MAPNAPVCRTIIDSVFVLARSVQPVLKPFQGTARRPDIRDASSQIRPKKVKKPLNYLVLRLPSDDRAGLIEFQPEQAGPVSLQ